MTCMLMLLFLGQCNAVLKVNWDGICLSSETVMFVLVQNLFLEEKNKATSVISVILTKALQFWPTPLVICQ